MLGHYDWQVVWRGVFAPCRNRFQSNVAIASAASSSHKSPLAIANHLARNSTSQLLRKTDLLETPLFVPGKMIYTPPPIPPNLDQMVFLRQLKGFGGKRKNNEHKEIRRNAPTSGPQPSRGRVPFVLWKCPIRPADILSNLCGIARESGRDVPDARGIRHQTAPETLPRHLRNEKSAQRGSYWPDIPVRTSTKNFSLKNFGLIFRSLTPTTTFLYVFFVYRFFFSLCGLGLGPASSPKGFQGPLCQEPRKSPKRVPKESWSRTPRVQKECAPHLKTVRRKVLDSFWTLLRLQGALFWDSAGPAPADSFGTLSGLFWGSGPEGPGRPKGGGGRTQVLSTRSFSGTPGLASKPTVDSSWKILANRSRPGMRRRATVSSPQMVSRPRAARQALAGGLSCCFVVHVLSVPDVSRERRCLQTSPEQLMATKDTKKTTKFLNFRLPEDREFLGRWDKTFKHCRNTEIPHLGSLLGRTQVPRHKLDNNLNFRILCS